MPWSQTRNISKPIAGLTALPPQSHGPGHGQTVPSKPPSIVSRTTAVPGPDGAPGDASFGVGAGVSVAEGMGFWINSIKPGGPAEQVERPSS